MHRLGDLDAGMELQLQGVKRWNDTGSKLHETYREVHLADSFIYEGKYAEARVHLDAARTRCTNYGEAYLAPEIYRLEGVLLQHEQAPSDVVEGYLIDSLNTARRQEARLFELRTAITLARILSTRGERRQALNMLAPIYGWFNQGFEAVDLKHAKLLLHELGQGSPQEAPPAAAGIRRGQCRGASNTGGAQPEPLWRRRFWHMRCLAPPTRSFSPPRTIPL